MIYKIEEAGKIIGYNVVAGGGLGTTHGNEKTYPRIATMLGYASKENVLKFVYEIVTTQRDFGNREDRKLSRLKYTIDRMGLVNFKSEVEKRVGLTFENEKSFSFQTRSDSFGWAQDHKGLWHFTLFVENVSLFSQFYIINWFARFKNVLKDTDQQVKYTRNEENIHALVGIKIINTIREELPSLFDEELEQKIHSEAHEAFKSEAKIVDWMINGIQEPSLSAPILKEFIKNRINESLAQIGFKPAFEVDKELLESTMWFEEELLGNNMVDFFHSRPVDYAKNTQSFSEDDLF
jgi:hypothetical protein